jgi:multiple sugar transport system permease protein
MGPGIGASSSRSSCPSVEPRSSASLFSFLFGWGDFLFALILNNDPHHTPITVGIYRFIGSFSVEWPAVMATAVIASIPATFLLAIAQRYIAAGITAGALKE